jgi:hypothetical protein
METIIERRLDRQDSHELRESRRHREERTLRHREGN